MNSPTEIESAIGGVAVPARATARAGIVPVTIIISTITLAAASGFYVWRETTPPTLQQQPDPAARSAQPARLPPAPASNAELTASSATAARVPAPAPGTHRRRPAAEKTPAVQHHATAVEILSAQDGAAASGQIEPLPAAAPIRIEHGQDSAAVDPDVLAAYQAYQRGDFDNASQRYRAVLQRDVRNRDALLGMAAIAQQRSQDASAAQYYSRLLALDPRDPAAHAGLYSMLGSGDAAGSESRIKLLLAQHPAAAALHAVLGNHYAQQSRWSAARQAYSSACQLEPDNAQFAFNLAVSLDHLGQFTLAAHHYQRALQLDSAGFDRTQTQQRLHELASSPE